MSGGNSDLCRNGGPVSYTHLDVYKRQLQCYGEACNGYFWLHCSDHCILSGNGSDVYTDKNNFTGTTDLQTGAGRTP